MIHSCAFLAYLSPETLLPATSVIATIAGIGMILGRGSLRFLIRCCRRSLRVTSKLAETSQPHFRLREEETYRVFRR
ncbi:MAG: hypothetical protein ACLQIB_30385 [Isosphaeraceae bacterium]